LLSAPALLFRSEVPLAIRERLALVRAATWAFAAGFEIRRDVDYRSMADGPRMDLYLPPPDARPSSVVLYFHGGGWAEGSKELASLAAVEWAKRGFAVVNVGYRLASTAPAPAAVEDARCAAAWIGRNADRLGLDTSRITATGVSAGAHLALMTALPDARAGLDRCGSPPKIAAVVNWYGPTDLSALDTSNARWIVRTWLGSDASLAQARRLSPITHVGPNTPTVLSVHGAEDDLVPIEQARRLHAALDAAGVPNHLRVMPAGGHGFERKLTSSLLDSLAAEVRAALESQSRYR
jgi:acetyl esterase/lipase